MSKINALVKKVELFERLSVYGDRSSFLKSLAQAAPTLDSFEKNKNRTPWEAPEAPSVAPLYTGHPSNPNDVPDPEEDGHVTIPEVTVKGYPPNKAVPTTIPFDQKVQNLQVAYNSMHPKSKINPDGRYGQSTEAAINNFIKEMGGNPLDPTLKANVKKQLSTPAAGMMTADVIKSEIQKLIHMPGGRDVPGPV